MLLVLSAIQVHTHAAAAASRAAGDHCRCSQIAAARNRRCCRSQVPLHPDLDVQNRACRSSLWIAPRERGRQQTANAEESTNVDVNENEAS
jgi:hypothetical protein